MTRVVSFRPGVAEAQSAFEAMADIYGYLQEEYDYEFTLLISEDDSFESDALDVRRIPTGVWKSLVPRCPVYPRRLAYRRHVDQVFERADLVLTVDPTAYPQGALGIRRANRVGTPVWFDASATVNGDFEPLQLLKRPVERSLLRNTDRVLTTVPKSIERFRDRRLYDETVADKFEILGHPVDTDHFCPGAATDRKETVVLTVSRLVPEKGLLYILEALAPLLRSQPTLEFHVLGDGPMESHLRRRADQLDIGDSVAFLGTVTHEQVPKVLSDADVFVNHAVGNSHWEEFFGVANLEAMACGVPPVVSDSGGIPYSIRREGVAKVVTERSVVDLRAAIRELVENPDEREVLGEQARDYVVDTYAIERIGDRYHKLVTDEI